MSTTEELRAMAENVGLAMPQAATLMMGAADAIDRLDAKNASLRSELEYVGTAAYMYGHSDLKAENAKLRKLVEGLNWHIETDGLCKDCPLGESLTPFEVMCEQMMKELGIEVKRDDDISD